MSKITLSGRTIGSVQVTSTDRTTIVKSITVGTPIRSVIGAGSTFDGLNDVTISGASNNDFIQFDSSAQKFVNRSAPVFTTIASSLIPSADSTYDLGSAAAKWRDLYLSGSTLNLGGLAIKDQSGTFSVADSTGTAVGFDLSGSQSQIRGFFSGAGDITYNSSTGEFSIDVEATYSKANFDSDFNTALDETALGGTGLTFDSASNTLSITNTGVDSAVYGSATQIPVLTVNARGQIDSAGTVNVAGVSSTSFDSASRIFTINTADGGTFSTMIATRDGEAGTYGSATQIPVLTINAFGQVDSIGTTTVAGVSSTSYDSSTGIFTINTADGNSFATHIQDSADLVRISRSSLSGGTGITYNSTTGEITTTDGDIVHDNLSGFVANEHIDHSTVSVVAGKGLTGGGTITTNRTIDIDSANVRGMFSATDAGGDGSFSYNSGTGAFTYTGPSAAEVKAHFQPLDSNANPTFNQLRGPAEFIIDPAAIGNATGSVKILGDLQVEGTTTTINSTTVTLNDKNIVIGDSAADSSALNGGGITWGGSNIVDTPSLTYDHANAEFDLNRDLRVTSDIIADDDITANGLLTASNADASSAGLKIENSGGSSIKAYFASAVDSADFFLTRNGTGGAEFKITNNGQVVLSHGGTRLFTRTDGVTVNGNVVADSISLADDASINFGDNDLRILHNGVNSKINNNTGALQITNFADNADVTISTDDGSGGTTNYFRADGSTGKTILYYYGTEKLTTESDGVTVTGSLVADSATINGGSIFFDSAGNTDRLQLTHSLQQSSDVLRLQTSSGRIDIGAQNTGYAHFVTDRARFYFQQQIMAGDGKVTSYNQDLQLQRADTTKLTLTEGGATVTGSLVSDSVSTGPLNLTGIVTQTVGNSSVSELTGKWRYKRNPGSENIELLPNAAYTGWHPNILMRSHVTGTAMYMLTNGNRVGIGQYDAGTGGTPRDMSAMITFQPSADSTPRLDIGDAGSVNGELGIGGNVILGDSLGFSTSELIQSTAAIELSGGVTYDPAGGGPDTANDVGIALTTGTRIIGADNGYIRTLLEWNQSNALEIGQSGTALINHTKIFGGTNGVELYESTAKKLETTPYGVTVTGTMNADSVTVTGNITTTGGRFYGSGSSLTDLNADNISSGTIDSARIPPVAGADITHGLIDAARIPVFGTSQITSGTFDSARIPVLSAADIVTGTFDSARIPVLSAADIVTGTIDSDRLPTGTFTTGGGGGTGSLDSVHLTNGNFAGLDIDSANIALVNITGNTIKSTAGQLTVTSATSGKDLQLGNLGNHSIRANGSTSGVELGFGDLGTAANKKLETTAYGVTVSGTMNADSATISGDLTVDTTTLHVDATNNRVGIGTTSPSADLHVSNASGSELRIDTIGGSNANSVLNFRENGVDRARLYWDGADNDLYLETTVGDIALMPTGNVGIGTTSPTEKLEVHPDSDQSAIIGRAHVGYQGYSDFAGFSHVDQNGTASYSLLQNSSGSTYLNAASGGNIFFRVANSTKLQLYADKFVSNVPIVVGSTGSYTLDGDSAEVASVSQTSIAEFAHASYCGAKFIVTASQGTKRQISELLVTHDGTTAVATEYGTITTDSDLASFDVDISGSDVRLLATGTSATSTRYKVVETLIEA